MLERFKLLYEKFENTNDNDHDGNVNEGDGGDGNEGD